jgi:hypothetical protein
MLRIAEYYPVLKLKNAEKPAKLGPGHCSGGIRQPRGRKNENGAKSAAGTCD